MYYKTNFYSPIASATKVMTIREATTTEAVDAHILLVTNEYYKIKVVSFLKNYTFVHCSRVLNTIAKDFIRRFPLEILSS